MSLKQDFLSGLQTALQQEGEKLQTALADEVDTRGITDRGNLRDDWEQLVVMSGAGATLEITGVSYANAVAEGTSGYSQRPPAPAIKSWVQSKLNLPDPLVPSATFKIREAIFKEGTPTLNSPLRGRNDYVKAALRRRLPDFEDTLERSIADATS